MDDVRYNQNLFNIDTSNFKDKQFSAGSVGVCLREVSLYKNPTVPISL